MAEGQPGVLPFATPCTLEPPAHILRARDQLAALLHGLVERCGAHSAVAGLAKSTVTDEIGAHWVLHVDRRVVVSGCNLVPQVGRDGGRGVGENHYYGKSCMGYVDLVCIGVSLTLGVVDLWGRANVDQSWLAFDAGWVGHGRLLTLSGLLNFMTGTMEAAFSLNADAAVKGRKWVVMISPFSWVRSIIVCPVLEVGRRVYSVLAMLDGDEAVVTVDGDLGDSELWCVDLNQSYESGKLVRTDSGIAIPVTSYDCVVPYIFRKKQGQKVIVEGANLGPCTVPRYALELPSALKSRPPPRALLRRDDSQRLLWQVDNDHFAAKENNNHQELKIFSTDDCETPLRVFPVLNWRLFDCGNGFIVFQEYECSCIDLVDAVTGTWILRQPTPTANSLGIAICTS
ncbi:hypothetical protein Pelo_15059 [Pelomyxa schiedti]|nr:hypothetical protein Pelo_15059 [Pelomyxa schiedti]